MSCVTKINARKWGNNLGELFWRHGNPAAGSITFDLGVFNIRVVPLRTNAGGPGCRWEAGVSTWSSGSRLPFHFQDLNGGYDFQLVAIEMSQQARELKYPDLEVL
jgi:hypothetical protein